MKKAIVLLLSCVFFTMVQANEVITVASGEWPPLTGQSLKDDGLFTHIVRRAYALEGYQLKVDYFPWKRSFKSVTDGEHEISLGWLSNERRRQDVLFNPSPVITLRKVLFHRVDKNIEWNKFEDFKHYIIGLSRGYAYGDHFESMLKTLPSDQVQYANNDLQNLKKVLRGRIDIFPVEAIVGYSLTNTYFSAPQARLLTNHSKAILETSYHIILSKKLPSGRADELLQAFERGLKKLKQSGEYEAMMERSLEGYYQ